MSGPTQLNKRNFKIWHDYDLVHKTITPLGIHYVNYTGSEINSIRFLRIQDATMYISTTIFGSIYHLGFSEVNISNSRVPSVCYTKK